MKEIMYSAYSFGLKQWRISLFVYLIQFILVLFLALQFEDIIQSGFGKSLELKKLLAQYNHTVIMDFVKTNSALISHLLSSLKYLLILWFFVAVFLDGGQLYGTKLKDKISIKEFLQGASESFFPFLKLAVLFLLMAGIWSASIIIPLLMNLESMIRYFDSEKYAVWILVFLLCVWVIGLLILFSWSILSRLDKLQMDSSLLNHLKNGWKRLKVNRSTIFKIVFLYIAILLLLLKGYWWLDEVLGAITPVLILIFFIIQQSCVLIRIFIRQIMYKVFSEVTDASE